MALFEWHWPHERSLKIGPRPSCTVSVEPKAADASANNAALVPGSAPPSAPSVESTWSVSSPHPIVPASTSAPRTDMHLLFVVHIRVPPWGRLAKPGHRA